MSDTRWWRLRDWVTDVLKQSPIDASELSSLPDKSTDILYVGMIIEDMIHKGEVNYLKGVFSLSTKEGKNNGSTDAS
jgi:hypothetical protein